MRIKKTPTGSVYGKKKPKKPPGQKKKKIPANGRRRSRS